MATVADRREISLVDRMAAGDDSALAAVYDELGPVVYGLAVRLVGVASAADICQEVFVTLWDHSDHFDPARGSLRALLVTICRRRCIDHLRRHGRREATELRAARAVPTPSQSVDDAAVALLERQRVHDALDTLPPAQRQAIELAYFDGLTFRQVAVATGASEGTAKSRIRLGLQRLATELRAYEEVRLT